MTHANHLAIWLYSAAVALEVAAILCVGADIIKARRRSAAFVENARRRSVNLRGVAAHLRSGGSATLTGGHQPTLDDRVTVLERKVGALAESIDGMISKALGRAIKEVEAAAEDVRATAEARLQLLAEATDVTGSRRLALVGVVLLFMSIIVGFLGNIASANGF